MKYFCEKCEKELTEPFCFYTTGHILCGECLPIFLSENAKDDIVILPPPKRIDLIRDFEAK